MVLNFQDEEDYDFYKRWDSSGRCWVFKDMFQALEYIEESGIEGEIFFDTSNNITYQIINSHLEVL